jgi:hypothetical protein
VYTVIGKPIHLEKVTAPTQQQVDEVHERYINELKDLFDQHKGKYLKNKDTVLQVL